MQKYSFSSAAVRTDRCAALWRFAVLGLGAIFITEIGAQPTQDISKKSPPAVTGTGDFKVEAKHLLVPLPKPTPAELQKNPPSLDAHSIEGVWLAEPMVFGPGAFAMPQLPYTEKARQVVMQQMQLQREADAQGKILITDSGRCRPSNGIGIGADLFPAEVIQTEEKIVILNEELRGRWVIYMKRDHRGDIKNTYFGDSIGRWEGDTLIVDTIGLRAVTSLMSLYTDKVRIVSRLRKTDGGQKLELISTTYDSDTYTQPFEGRKTISYWHPGVQLLEFQCEENMDGAREGMVG